MNGGGCCADTIRQIVAGFVASFKIFPLFYGGELWEGGAMRENLPLCRELPELSIYSVILIQLGPSSQGINSSPWPAPPHPSQYIQLAALEIR